MEDDHVRLLVPGPGLVWLQMSQTDGRANFGIRVRHVPADSRTATTESLVGRPPVYENRWEDSPVVLVTDFGNGEVTTLCGTGGERASGCEVEDPASG